MEAVFSAMVGIGFGEGLGAGDWEKAKEAKARVIRMRCIIRWIVHGVRETFL
jgi:hypothetical protein